MRRTCDPFRLLLVSVAGWLGQQQRDTIDYLREENQVLGSQPVPSGTSSSESEPPSTPPAASFHGLEDGDVCLLKQEVLGAVFRHHLLGVVNLTMSSVMVNGQTVPIDKSHITVRLKPGSGSRLEFKMARYANRPTLARLGTARGWPKQGNQSSLNTGLPFQSQLTMMPVQAPCGPATETCI